MNYAERLNSLYEETMSDVLRAGLSPGDITSVQVNSRYKKTLGKCEKESYGRRISMFAIQISAKLLADEIPDQVVKNTIAHEILHTCHGCFNHGPNWKRAAFAMEAFGYHITRTTSVEECGVKVEPLVYRYHFRCTGCGSEIHRTKRSKFVRLYDKYRCGICYGKFVKI